MRRLALSSTRDRARQALFATVLSALLGLAVADAAQAASTWLTPTNRQPSGTTGSFGTDAAMNPRGDAIGAWSGSDGTNQRVFAAYRPRGGPYKSTTMVSTAGVSASFNDGAAIDNAGRAFLAWTEGGVVKLAVSSTAGVLSGSDTLSQTGASNPDVALRPDGTAVIVWVRNGVVEYITRSPGGSYSPPAGAQPLSDAGGGAFSHHVAFGVNGDIAVVWARASQIEARYRPAGAADFGAVEVIAPAAASVSFSGPKVAVDASGRATAVWQQTDNNVPAAPRSIQTGARTRTIPFGGASPVNTPTTDSVGSPDIGVDDSGFVTTTWHRSTVGALRIEAATKPQGGSFGTTQPVSETSGSADVPEIKVNGPGDIIVIWNRFVAGISTRIIEAKFKPAGTSFDQNAVQLVSSEGDYSDFPDAGLDSDGNGIAFYGRSVKPCCPEIKVNSAGLDSAGPSFTALSTPASGLTGQALGFSATTFDQWSTVNVGWNFGDGGVASGKSVSHAFGAGTFNVTATATDAVGNSASATRTVQVANPPSSNPPSSPPSNPPGGGALTVLPSTASINSLAFAKFTKLVNLSVKNLQAGSTVRVTCKTKKKKQQKKGCPYKSKRFTTSGARARLNLRKPFRNRKIPVGTKITITITAPGFLGKRVTYTMRARKLPKSRVQCLSATGKAGSCA